jgi:hypothetical protein
VDFTGCTSSFVPNPAKRGLEAAKKRAPVVERREETAELEALLICRHKGIHADQCEV